MNIQNQLMNNIWQHNTRSIMSEFVRIIGRVVGEVTIPDINKKIAYNQVMDINVEEVLSSKDFETARRERWIEIIQGKHILDSRGYNTVKQVQVQAPVQTQPMTNVTNIQIDMNEIKNTVAQTTKETVQSILSEVLSKIKVQDTPNLDVDKLANAIAGKISIGGQVQVSKQEIDKLAESVFVNIDTADELKSNIQEGELGVVTIKKENNAKSKISKIKKLKGVSNGNEKS